MPDKLQRDSDYKESYKDLLTSTYNYFGRSEIQGMNGLINKLDIA